MWFSPGGVKYLLQWYTESLCCLHITLDITSWCARIPSIYLQSQKQRLPQGCARGWRAPNSIGPTSHCKRSLRYDMKFSRHLILFLGVFRWFCQTLSQFVSSLFSRLRKQPFLPALLLCGRFARRNVGDSAVEIPWRKSMFTLFITSTLKSLAIRAIWLALSSVIYS